MPLEKYKGRTKRIWYQKGYADGKRKAREEVIEEMGEEILKKKYWFTLTKKDYIDADELRIFSFGKIQSYLDKLKSNTSKDKND